MDEAYAHVGSCPRSIGRRCEWHETRWREYWLETTGYDINLMWRQAHWSSWTAPVLNPRPLVTIIDVSS
jgi:hypothetical protein